MDLRLDGKPALVTGATRGVGIATARALARAGADVVGCHHGDERTADDASRALAETGGKHRIVRADVTRPDDGAARSGITGMTRALSKELGPKGVRVNAVAPGVVDTGPDSGLPAEVRARMARMSALGRLVTAEEVAQGVLFLACDTARYVTGVTLNVDGGL
ncbi:SDR family NAD(P)-dependent oxidoreductase [Streptomyces sp. NPDC014991]|uniref:SDR family NAD(P)-dependent oxidoreductase n=1 Tax=Streptomyces sp. NPDC014991 TaxID=3364935 RepID=UPI0036FCF27D